MLAAVPNPIASVKPPQPLAVQTAQKTSQPQAPETARASAGETAAANVRSESVQALKAAEQSAVAPRLRDQERAESTDRVSVGIEAHAGPPPTFEESPLERQARVALDPPEIEAPAAAPLEQAPPSDDAPAPDVDEPSLSAAPAEIDPPPTPSERAEASFAETRTIADKPERASVDVRH